MAYKPTELLTVYLDARNQRHKVGRLAFKDKKVLFEYYASFVATGIDISPIRLPLKLGVAIANTSVFDGLFGVFNDSLPDGWGRLLLDRTVERYGVLRGQLTPLDRLGFVPKRIARFITPRSSPTKPMPASKPSRTRAAGNKHWRTPPECAYCKPSSPPFQFG